MRDVIGTFENKIALPNGVSVHNKARNFQYEIPIENKNAEDINTIPTCPQ